MEIAASFEKTGNPYTDVILALEASGCPYLIIGGVAVVMHGSNRFTPDVNILIDFSSSLFGQAVRLLESIGLRYASTGPMPDVRDPAVRQSLCGTGEVLLRFEDPSMPNFSVDMLLADIGDFEDLFTRRSRFSLESGHVSVVGLDDLLEMKRELNRMQDQVDVGQLEFLKKIHARSGERSFDVFEADAPPGVEESSFESLLAFQDLSHEDRFSWLRDVLAAVGGFCMF